MNNRKTALFLFIFIFKSFASDDVFNKSLLEQNVPECEAMRKLQSLYKDYVKKGYIEKVENPENKSIFFNKNFITASKYVGQASSVANGVVTGYSGIKDLKSAVSQYKYSKAIVNPDQKAMMVKHYSQKSAADVSLMLKKQSDLHLSMSRNYLRNGSWKLLKGATLSLLVPIVIEQLFVSGSLPFKTRVSDNPFILLNTDSKWVCKAIKDEKKKKPEQFSVTNQIELFTKQLKQMEENFLAQKRYQESEEFLKWQTEISNTNHRQDFFNRNDINPTDNTEVQKPVVHTIEE